jgi:putative oxidoreductase
MSALTAPSHTGSSVPSVSLHRALWGAQILLALAFAGAAFPKVFQPMEALHAQMPWVESVPAAAVRLAGVSELLGVAGLILPSATRIAPRLTVLAALGLVTVMALGSMVHLSRGELGMLPINAALGGLAAFVAWGRARRAPIAPRA